MSVAPPGTLVVKVVEARDLKSMDWSKNDPYVTLSIKNNAGGEDVPAAPRFRRTEILQGAGKHPRWGEVHEFRVVPCSGLAIEVCVWESDGAADDFDADRLNGKVVLALDSIFQRKAGDYSEKDYNILKPGTKKAVVHGAVKAGLWLDTAAAGGRAARGSATRERACGRSSAADAAGRRTAANAASVLARWVGGARHG